VLGDVRVLLFRLRRREPAHAHPDLFRQVTENRQRFRHTARARAGPAWHTRAHDVARPTSKPGETASTGKGVLLALLWDMPSAQLASTCLLGVSFVLMMPACGDTIETEPEREDPPKSATPVESCVDAPCFTQCQSEACQDSSCYFVCNLDAECVSIDDDEAYCQREVDACDGKECGEPCQLPCGEGDSGGVCVDTQCSADGVCLAAWRVECAITCDGKACGDMCQSAPCEDSAACAAEVCTATGECVVDDGSLNCG